MQNTYDRKMNWTRFLPTRSSTIGGEEVDYRHVNNYGTRVKRQQHTGIKSMNSR